jgi:SAM-dependent methyltransferase
MWPDSQSFAQRAELTEWMDEPCSYSEFRNCLRDLMQVNRIVFSYRPTLQWLEQFAGHNKRPLHILDVGSGAGDMLRKIERWAQAKKIAVRLTGIDLNPHAAQAAREFTQDRSEIEWVTGEVFEFAPERGIDVVLSSLFAHHLKDAEIVRFLAWMERTAALGWFVNDLKRARGSYVGFTMLSRVMRWHRFVQHDGPVSIQRAFREADWERYASEAGLMRDGIRIYDAWPGRLCVSRVKR